MLYNRIRYDSEESGDDSIVRESELKWVPISTLVTQQYPMSIGRKAVNAQDNTISLGSLTEYTDSSLFSIDTLGF